MAAARARRWSLPRADGDGAAGPPAEGRSPSLVRAAVSPLHASGPARECHAGAVPEPVPEPVPVRGARPLHVRFGAGEGD